jgi:hypothetical protein
MNDPAHNKGRVNFRVGVNGGSKKMCPECDSACKTWPWLLFIGFTLLFSAIFSEVWHGLRREFWLFDDSDLSDLSHLAFPLTFTVAMATQHIHGPIEAAFEEHQSGC